MKISAEAIQYMKGEKFSSGYRFPLEKNEPIPRLDMLKKITQGKTVIHVGCADHLSLIDKKIEKGIYLHKILTDNCSRVVGFDINKEAIEHMKVRGFDNVHCMNILDDKAEISDIVFGKTNVIGSIDYVILGEIVEHLDNPVEFLSELKEQLSDIANEIIITVPCGFSYQCQSGINNSYELINSDHRFWFSPYTICKVCVRAGIMPIEVLFADRQEVVMDKKTYPTDLSLTAGTLILIGKLKT